MIGCIRCHRATDEEGNCYICDKERIRMRKIKLTRHHPPGQGYPCPCGQPVDHPIHLPIIEYQP